MGNGKREPYENGDFKLGWHRGNAVADFVDQSGVRRRPTLGKFDTYQDEKDALDKFANSMRAEKKRQEAYTVADLWKMWLTDRKEDGHDNTRYEHVWTILKPTFAARHPSDIEADDCRKYARQRFALGRSSHTVNTELRRLRSCLNWAEKRNKIVKAPFIWIPSPGKGRERVLSFDEAKALVTADVSGHIQLFIVLAITTAARHAAILDLTWDRIDFDKGSINYELDLPPDPMSKSFKKARANAPMNMMAREALTLAYEAAQTDHVIEYRGKRLKGIRDGFAIAVAAAGLDTSETNVTPHTLRHTIQTWGRQGLIEKERMAALLGHTDLRSGELYTHVDTVEFARPAADMIDQKLALDAPPENSDQK